MSSPADLIEALGVMPLAQIVPKQELAPLLSFSRFDPCEVNPSSYLSTASSRLAEAAERELNDGSNVHAATFFSELLQNFESPELQRLRFKKPVILGHSDRTPHLPSLGPFHKTLLGVLERVQDQELCELEPDLGESSVFEEKMDVLESWSDKELARKHVQHYKQLLAQEMNRASRKRLCSPLPGSLGMPSKRSQLDQKRLVNQRENELYLHVQQLEDESKLPDPGLLRQISTILSGLSRSNEISNLKADHLQRIESSCSRFIMSTLHSATDIGPYTVPLLTASEIILTIMNAGIDDCRLHVESFLESVIKCIDALVKLGLAFAKEDGETEFSLRKVGHCIGSLSTYLTSTKVNELVLSHLEYLSINAVFLDVQTEGFDDLRSSLINLLAQIFKSYPTQRHFIVNELLLNFKRLSQQRSIHQLRLRSGLSVLFFTAFLLRLVQSFDALSMSKEAKAFLRLQKSKSPHSAKTLKRVALLKSMAGLYDESAKIANQIVRHFLSSILAGDADVKAILSVFVSEIISLVPFPEWSGSITILDAMMRTFMAEFEADRLTGQTEPYILETIGKVGYELSKLKVKVHSVGMNASNEHDVEMISNIQIRILSELRDLSHELALDQDFHYLLLKFLKMCESLQDQAVRNEGESHIFALKQDDSSNNTLLAATILVNQLADDLLAVLLTGSFPNNQPVLGQRNSSGQGYLALVLGDGLDNLYEQYFSILITSLESSKVKVATKAIKLLSPLIDIDTRLLLTLRVNQSVSRLLTGNSPLSRDAVIDLLGKYISDSPDLTLKYYKAISERAGDTSVLVRRRVIKIMRSMYQQTLEVEVRGFIAIKFLQHTNDIDKPVSEATNSHLMDLWLDRSIPRSDICDVMVFVVGSGSGIEHQFRSFLTSMGDKTNIRELIKVLKPVAAFALESTIEQIEGENEDQAIKNLKFLSVLMSWNRRLITFDDFLLLLPYVFEETRVKNAKSLYILRILKFLINENRLISKENLSRMREELLTRLTKFDVLELKEAVPIMQLLSALLGDNSSLVNALRSCLRALRTLMNDKKVLLNEDSQKCYKLLHLTGCIGTFCQLEESRSMLQEANIGLLQNETIVSLVLKYLLHFSKDSYSESVKIAALKNIILVCSSYPKIMMSESVLKVLDLAFQGDCDRSKLAVVEGLNEFLLNEEKLAALEANNTISSRTAKLDKGNFHGTVSQGIQEGISASIIQRYLESVLKMCVRDSSTETLIPVRFLRLVVKLGFANPKVCIPTIISLEASSNKLVKKIANELHTELFEKHESLATRNYREAFVIAYQLTKRSWRDEYWKNISFLRTVYGVVSRNYMSKKRFVLSLAKLFTLDTTLTSLPKAIDQRDSTVFLAINLLVVNFTSVEEVCLLLYHLDRSITMDGIDLADKITKLVESNTGTGMSVTNLQLLFVGAQTVLALIYLRQLLAASYGITSVLMETFRPSKPDIELRQAPRSVLVIDFPLAELELGTNLAQPSGFGKVFTRLVLSMKSYTT